MVSLKTQIAGFSFDNCLMNAAGVSCMTVEELEAVRQSSAGTFITKTATLTPRQGNPEPRYRDVPLGSINSMGLPNQGIDYYLDYLLTLQETQPERTLFLTLVGLSPDETHTLLKKCKTAGSTALPNSTFPVQTSPANRKSPTTLKPPSKFWAKPLPTSTSPWASNCHRISTLPISIRPRKCSTAIP